MLYVFARDLDGEVISASYESEEALLADLNGRFKSFDFQGEVDAVVPKAQSDYTLEGAERAVVIRGDVLVPVPTYSLVSPNGVETPKKKRGGGRPRRKKPEDAPVNQIA